MKERVELLRALKEEASIAILKFAKIDAEQTTKLKENPTFAKGLEFYNDLNLSIIKELDNDIGRTEKEIEMVATIKESKIKDLLAIIEMPVQKYEFQSDVEEAFKTMRHLPPVGYGNYAIDFTWPTLPDLLAMPYLQPIHVESIKWDKSHYISGIQLTLSNGIKSPFFLAEDIQENEKNC